MRPIRLPVCSVNHKLPSGPAVIASGSAPGVMPTLNSVTTPAVVMRPIRLKPRSVNHRLPSGPAVIAPGSAATVMPALNSVTTCGPCTAGQRTQKHQRTADTVAARFHKSELDWGSPEERDPVIQNLRSAAAPLKLTATA